MVPTSCRLAGLVVCLSCCLSLSAVSDSQTPSAPDAGTPPEESSADAGVSAEDMKALEEALGKDTAAAAQSGAASSAAAAHRPRLRAG